MKVRVARGSGQPCCGSPAAEGQGMGRFPGQDRLCCPFGLRASAALPGKIDNLRLLRLPFAAADVFLRIDGWRLWRQAMQVFAEMMQVFEDGTFDVVQLAPWLPGFTTPRPQCGHRVGDDMDALLAENGFDGGPR